MCNMILILIVFLSVSATSQNCNPMFPRLFYTQNPQKMIIKFDTYSQCPKDYVTINQNQTISKYYCSTQLLSIKQSTTFNIYIHTCHIQINISLPTFQYTIVQNSQNSVETTISHEVHIPQENQTFILVTAADWGPIVKRNYTPLHDTLQLLLNQKQQLKVSAFLINGDIAYELYSNQCDQYIKFMEQLTQVSRFWPLIFVVGNHERRQPSQTIFLSTFQSFGLSEQFRVQTHKFWNFKIITFDPYLQIYDQSTTEQYEKMKNKLIQQVEKESQKKDSYSPFIMISCHYPLICSEDVTYCRDSLQKMPDLYQELSQTQKVDFYLGSHMHQYERVYPYKNREFIKKQSPYHKGQFVSLVEGVAGCDTGIIEEDWETKEYSAYHTFNKTGLGIIKIQNISKDPSFQYTHIVTDPPLKVVDQIQILPFKFNLKIQ